MFKRLFPLAAALGVTAAAACNDSTGFEAQLATISDTLTVYAMSGSPPSLPSAFSALTGVTMRIDTLGFDVAFDIPSPGRIALYPVNVIGQTPAGRRVGLRVDSTTAFENIHRAPVGGYVRDSVVTFAVGKTVILEVPGNCGLYALGNNVYTKLVVDSANVATRKIDFRVVHDPNCGFRSFRAGIPKD